LCREFKTKSDQVTQLSRFDNLQPKTDYLFLAHQVFVVPIRTL